jgi:hypothetical protein
MTVALKDKVEASGYCKRCGKDVVVWRRNMLNFHVGTTLLTCGAYLLVLPLVLAIVAGTWKCSQCGRRAKKRLLQNF